MPGGIALRPPALPELCCRKGPHGENSLAPRPPLRTCSFITSPQAGAPTRPVPTLGSFLSKLPTLRGCS